MGGAFAVSEASIGSRAIPFVAPLLLPSHGPTGLSIRAGSYVCNGVTGDDGPTGLGTLNGAQAFP